MTNKPGSRSIAQELRRLVLLTVLPLVAIIVALAYVAQRSARLDAEELVQSESARVAANLARVLHDTERVLRRVAAHACAGHG